MDDVIRGKGNSYEEIENTSHDDDDNESVRISKKFERLNNLILEQDFLSEKDLKLWKLMSLGSPAEAIMEEMNWTKNSTYSSMTRLKNKIKKNISLKEIS